MLVLNGRLNMLTEFAVCKVLNLFPTLTQQCLGIGKFINEMIEVPTNKPGPFGSAVNAIDDMREEGIVLLSGLEAGALKGIAVKHPSLNPLLSKLKTCHMAPLLLDDLWRPRMHEVAARCARKKTYPPFLPSN